MNNYKHIIALISTTLAILCSVALHAQSRIETEAEYDSIYAKRIQMSEINGVYIPRNLEDAFAELTRLSSPADLEKFKNASEEVARTKLHFSLGRWMIVNWNLYEGSRLSNFLREAGLQLPDDMARVILVCFHRHLNHQDVRFEEEVDYYRALREQEARDREASREVISEEKHIKKD